MPYCSAMWGYWKETSEKSGYWRSESVMALPEGTTAHESISQPSETSNSIVGHIAAAVVLTYRATAECWPNSTLKE